MQIIIIINISTSSFLTSNRTAALTHMKRIGDYLELGMDKWYRIHENAIEFLDGDFEQDSNPDGPSPTHFR